MGTKATTVIKNEQGKIILHLYSINDGYFTGHGKELVEFIRKGSLIQGMGLNANFGEVFNGMGDFACQLITHLKRPQRSFTLDPKHGFIPAPDKQSAGGFYLYPTEDTDYEYYHYEIGCENNKITLKAQGSYEVDEDDDSEVLIDEREFQDDNWLQLYPLTPESRKVLELEE